MNEETIEIRGVLVDNVKPSNLGGIAGMYYMCLKHILIVSGWRPEGY